MSNEILKKIVQVKFPDNQYVKSETTKTQIYLHHTVSPRNSATVVDDYWASTPETVATAIILNGDGVPYQLFSTRYWGYHLGLTSAIFKYCGVPYKSLDKISIGVEICSWGGLVQHTDGNWHPAKWDKTLKKLVPNLAVKAIPKDQVWLAPNGDFRGFKGFQKYSTEQIESLRQLLLYWGNRWNIPLTYREDIWDIDDEALKGTPGVYTHCSVRKDKSDCYPDENLISMLQSL